MVIPKDEGEEPPVSWARHKMAVTNILCYYDNWFHVILADEGREPSVSWARCQMAVTSILCYYGNCCQMIPEGEGREPSVSWTRYKWLWQIFYITMAIFLGDTRGWRPGATSIPGMLPNYCSKQF